MRNFKSGSQWLSFRLEGKDYCILSDYIESIAVPDKIDSLPEAPPSILGMTSHGKELICVVGMRELFGKLSLQKSVEDFAIMKDMHVSWVIDLQRYVDKGGEFTKSINPHTCKFGMWYDSFQTDNARLNRLLKKLSGPHESIHRCGADILELKKQGGDNKEKIDEIMQTAEDLCHEEIVPLLDRLIDVYRSMNRGVLLVIGNGKKRVGLLVDEVRNLILCNKTTQNGFNDSLKRSPYLGDIVMSADRIMLEVNIESILALTSDIEENIRAEKAL